MQKDRSNNTSAAGTFDHLLSISSDFKSVLIVFPYRSMRQLY
jgi:hypothetical protein